MILWQIGFQLQYGLFDDAIAADLALRLDQQALLGLSFLLPYAAMQWPAGRLVDGLGAKHLLAPAALGCALGSLLFAGAVNLPVAVAGRLITGVSAAFAFPSVAQLLRKACSGPRFTLAMALLESCIGFGAALVAGLVLIHSDWSWRSVTRVEALLAFCLAGWMALAFRRAWWNRQQPNASNLQARSNRSGGVQWVVVAAATGVYAWEAGLVFAFGDFWNLWLERQQMLSARAITISSLVFALALGLGTIAVGVLAKTRRRRCIAMLFGTSLGGVVLLFALLAPSAQRGWQHLVCLLLLGLSTSVGGLAFGEAGLAAPPQHVGMVIGLVNGVGCLTGGLFHVLPVDLMLVPGVIWNLVPWFGLLVILGWFSALVLWRSHSKVERISQLPVAWDEFQ